MKKQLLLLTKKIEIFFWEKEEVLVLNQTYKSSANNLLHDQNYINIILGGKNIDEYQRKFIYYRTQYYINNDLSYFLFINLEKIKTLPPILPELNNNSLNNIIYANVIFV